MRVFSAQELLDAWERGLAEPPVRRALILVAAACPEATFEDLARESVGRRDARLLTLREWTFGPRLVSLASCPACGERLETAFDVADIRTPEGGAEEPLALTTGGYELTFRLPNSLDVSAMAMTTERVTLGALVFVPTRRRPWSPPSSRVWTTCPSPCRPRPVRRPPDGAPGSPTSPRAGRPGASDPPLTRSPPSARIFAIHVYREFPGQPGGSGGPD
jgi:hypothetical protein